MLVSRILDLMKILLTLQFLSKKSSENFSIRVLRYLNLDLSSFFFLFFFETCFKNQFASDKGITRPTMQLTINISD